MKDRAWWNFIKPEEPGLCKKQCKTYCKWGTPTGFVSVDNWVFVCVLHVLFVWNEAKVEGSCVRKSTTEGGPKVLLHETAASSGELYDKISILLTLFLQAALLSSDGGVAATR